MTPLLSAFLCLLQAAAPPVTPRLADPPPVSAEEQLWRGILELQTAPPATQPFAIWFQQRTQQQRRLRERVQLYQTLYPGGVHHERALQIELQTLYELGVLAGGDFGDLCGRVRELLSAPPSRAAEAEAAYWELACAPREGTPADGDPQAGGPTTAPASRPATRPAESFLDRRDAERTAAYRAYLQKYPESRFVPRLATLVYEDAERHGDRTQMHAIAELLGARFPSHAQTQALLAAWNRAEAVGKPFALSFKSTAGQAVDTRVLVGRPVVIVVWAAHDGRARDRAVAVEAVRREFPRLEVLGVSLDPTPAETTAAAEALGLAWPQFNDGLGWGNEFVRAWGVRELPFVFVLDSAGRLVGATADERWQAWVRELLAPAAAREPNSATSDPKRE